MAVTVGAAVSGSEWRADVVTTSVLTLLLVLASLGLGIVIRLVRSQRVPPVVLPWLAGVCALGIGLMLVTDWPTDLLNDFWADHSILAASASTIFLVGIGYLVYEKEDQREQERLASGLSGAGLGGIVDHMVDVEVAIALLSSATAPTYDRWDAPDKPLRWMRGLHSSLRRDPWSGRPGPDDPRGRTVTLPPSEIEWRVVLVDQAVRRVLTAMRDWAPLIGRSDDGTTALIILSELRKDLMELSSHLERDAADSARPLMLVLRQRLRVLTYFFEDLSRNATSVSVEGADTPMRAEVLTSLHPLPPRGGDFRWEADLEDVPEFGRTWRQRLEGVWSTLEADRRYLAVTQVRELARDRHAGQITKQGKDYFDAHIAPIADRLASHGEYAVMAGLLHDILEDTPTTATELLDLGVPPVVVRTVEAVSKKPGEDYDELIRRAASEPLARIVKLADNAQNLADNAALAQYDPRTAERLLAKYERARAMLRGEAG